MLSKLFSNIKLGLSIWLILFSLALWSLTFYLNCPDCFSSFTTENWLEIGSVTILLITSLFLNSSIFNTFFRVTQNNYYAPLFVAIFVSWISVPLSWETGLEILLISVFYLNTYNIFNGNDDNQIGYHLTAGLLSLILTLLTPIGLGFLLLSIWQAAIDSHRGWRKFFLPLYSFAISFVILLGVTFLLDYQQTFITKFKFWDFYKLDTSAIKSNLIPVILTVALYLMAQKEYLKALRKAPILKRKALSVLNIHFIITSTLYVLLGSKPEYLVAPLFALSVLFANYFQYLKKPLIKELIIWVSVAGGIISASINLL